MLKLFKSIIIWFAVFGLSLLASTFGWAEQGNAFVFITALILIIYGITGICVTVFERAAFIVGYLYTISISLFLMWVATKLFNLDFTLVFQLVYLGISISKINRS